VIYPGGEKGTFSYSTAHPHFLETINDPSNGPMRRTEYDANGRVVALIDAAGNRIAQSWDPGSFSGTYTDARGNTTQLVYNDRGNLVQKVDPLGGTTKYEYLDAANPDRETAVTDPNGNIVRYTYDDRGNRLNETRPLRRHELSHTYDTNNQVTSIIYGSGARDSFERDTTGRITRINASAGEWQFDYTANGQVSAMAEGDGGVFHFEYEELASGPIRVISPLGRTNHFTLTPYGQIQEAIDPAGSVTRF
jgi:YD repeat-containing protein